MSVAGPETVNGGILAQSKLIVNHGFPQFWRTIQQTLRGFGGDKALFSVAYSDAKILSGKKNSPTGKFSNNGEEILGACVVS